MSNTIIVGDWVVFPSNNKLRFNDTDYFIEPLAMEVLVYFASHQDEVISRDELIESVWHGRVVGDHAVYRIINKLRKILAIDETTEYIKTIRKKGYQLVCEVSWQQVRAVSEGSASKSIDAELVVSNTSLGDPITAPTNDVGNKALSDDLIVPDEKARWSLKKKGLLLLSAVLLMAFAFIGVKFYSYYSIVSFDRATPLVTLDGTITSPSFSPDGKFIAFSYQALDANNADLFVESLVDGRLYQITDDDTDEKQPTWSPDGSTIAFLRYDRERCSIETAHFDLASSQSTTPQKELTECSGVLQHNDVDWSTDNKHLYYTSAISKVSPLQLFRLTIQTGKVEQLTNYTQGETRGVLGIEVAPDSKRIAILKDANWRDSTLQVLDLQTMKTRGVRKLVGWNRYFSWSNDGSMLVYNRNSKEVDAFELKSGVEKNIARSVEPIAFPIYSPTSDELVVITGRKVINIVSERLVGGEFYGHQDASDSLTSDSTEFIKDDNQSLTTVISSSSIDNYAEFANTSDTIAFVSWRTGKPQIWLRTVDGVELQLTQFSKDFEIRRIRWSPDDRSLIYIVNNSLYSINIKTKKVAELYKPEGDWSIEAENWSNDGRWIYFSSDKTGDWQVYRIDAAGSDDAEQLTLKGGYGALEDRETKGIYYFKYHASGLWYQDFTGSKEIKVIDNIDVFSNNSIYLRKGWVYYLADHFPQMKLYRFSIPEDSEKPMIEFVQDYNGSPWLLSISATGRRLLYQRSQQTHSSLILLRP